MTSTVTLPSPTATLSYWKNKLVQSIGHFTILRDGLEHIPLGSQKGGADWSSLCCIMKSLLPYDKLTILKYSSHSPSAWVILPTRYVITSHLLPSFVLPHLTPKMKTSKVPAGYLLQESHLDTFWICTVGNVCFQVKPHFHSCKGNDKKRKTQPIYISN